MDTYLVELHSFAHYNLDYHGPNRDANLIKQLIDGMRSGNVALLDWHKCHGAEIDNHDDGQREIKGTSTYIDVILEIDPAAEIDFHDGGRSLYKYVHDALTDKPTVISYEYQTEHDPDVMTVIGLKIE